MTHTIKSTVAFRPTPEEAAQIETEYRRLRATSPACVNVPVTAAIRSLLRRAAEVTDDPKPVEDDSAGNKLRTAMLADAKTPEAALAAFFMPIKETG